MASVTRTVHVKAGAWRTLEWFFNTTATGLFEDPAGASIKIRWGVGFFGGDRQKQTLDGSTTRTLKVSKGLSLLRARMQIRVTKDSDVTYTVQLPGP